MTRLFIVSVNGNCPKVKPCKVVALTTKVEPSWQVDLNPAVKTAFLSVIFGVTKSEAYCGRKYTKSEHTALPQLNATHSMGTLVEKRHLVSVREVQ